MEKFIYLLECGHKVSSRYLQNKLKLVECDVCKKNKKMLAWERRD